MAEEARRQEIEEFLATLSPSERRERIEVVPAYNDAYDAIVQPDEAHGALPDYFFDKWAPILGPIGMAVYQTLRRIAYANKKLPEDTWCYPDQSELARMIGLSASSRKTIRKHLDTLEKLRFLRRDASYRIEQQPQGGTLARRAASRYLLWYRIPLTDEDEVMLYLLNEGQSRNPLENQQVTHMGFTTPHRDPTHRGSSTPHGGSRPGVHNPTGDSYPQENSNEGFTTPRPDPSNNVSTSNVYPTLDNVREQSSFSKAKKGKPSAFQLDPRVRKLTPLERAKKDELVREIARALNGCKGEHGNDEHKSAGFHRCIAYFMPDELVMRAVMAVRDQHYDANVAGNKELRNPDAYFAGIIRNMATEHGISLKPLTGQPS